MARYKKIMAAIDGGATRLAVARRALSLAHDNNAEVLFAHVIESVELKHAQASLDEIAEMGKAAMEEALERQLSRALHDECVPSVEIEVRMGRIDDSLTEMARSFEPDLVICGVRGLSGIKYAFVGSTSTFLIRHMPCDVLVVRPEAIEEIDEAEYAEAEKVALGG